MTFEMVRTGWPNTVAVLALAVMPIVALNLGSDRASGDSASRQTEAAAVCPGAVACPMSVAAVAPEAVPE